MLSASVILPYISRSSHVAIANHTDDLRAQIRENYKITEWTRMLIPYLGPTPGNVHVAYNVHVCFLSTDIWP